MIAREEASEQAVRFTPKGFPYRVILWERRDGHKLWAAQVEGQREPGRITAVCPHVKSRPLAEVLADAEATLAKPDTTGLAAKPFTPKPDHRWITFPSILFLMLERDAEDRTYALLANPGAGAAHLAIKGDTGAIISAKLTAEQLRELSGKLAEAAAQIEQERGLQFGPMDLFTAEAGDNAPQAVPDPE